MSKKIRHLFLGLINFYQKYLSILAHGCCRYYPTCSEYSKLQFMHNSFFFACIYSFLRILRCNPLFDGGIDYPIVSKKFKINSCLFMKQKNILVIFWFVPKNNSYFYVIKANFSQIIK